MSIDNEQREIYLNKIILSLRFLLKDVQNKKEKEKIEKVIEQLEKVNVVWFN